MSGIAGIIGEHVFSEESRVLNYMAQRLSKERLHAPSLYLNQELEAGFAWASEPGSFSGEPIWNQSKDIGLVLSGETFPDEAQLKASPCDPASPGWNSGGYIVALYEKMGPQCINHLNGCFSGILIDLREKKMILFNDRYGLGRLYLHETQGGVYFSTEAKSLLCVLRKLRTLDMKSFAEICSCGCPLQNRTIFSGVSLLPPGSLWTFSPARPVKKEIYFQPEQWENQSPLGYGEYFEQLKETFSRVIPRYFRGSQPIAMSLTGGLDGRLIMAWANQQPGSLPCYTFGGAFRDCTDVKAARKIAAVCRQSHAVIPVGREFLNEFPIYAQRAICASDGAMDVSGAVELYVNRIASQIAPIRMTGNYGSEILRGHVAFRSRPIPASLFSPEMVELGREAEATYAEEARTDRLSFIAFKQVPWHHYARLSVERSQLTIRSPYLDNELVALAYRAPKSAEAKQKVMLALIAEGNPTLSGIPTDRGVVHRPIPFVSAANRLFQDLTVRAEYAYDYGMPQWLAAADHLLAPLHLERLFLGRHKFYHFRIWYRDELAEYVQAVLLDSAALSRPYLRRDRLEPMVKSHVAGEANFTNEIHRLLTCELIQRYLIEQ